MARTANPEELEALKSFLTQSTQAYADGAIKERKNRDGSIIGSFRLDPYWLVDRYFASVDGRRINGQEVVRQDGTTIWAAGYDGEIYEPTDIEEFIGAYREALKSPQPDLPIRGPKSIEVGPYTYKLDSVKGPLQVARFAVTEYMIKEGAKVYEGHLVGGWLGEVEDMPKEVEHEA